MQYYYQGRLSVWTEHSILLTVTADSLLYYIICSVWKIYPKICTLKSQKKCYNMKNRKRTIPFKSDNFNMRPILKAGS